ncbi:hypothetical protein DTO166G5_1367 [Paecilomyces variotii]|nr:hypothetical protein DTO166G5_1367 [Paecilomyces variotii]
MVSRKLTHDAYTVGWVCVLDCELNAARALLDEEDEPLEPSLHDDNLYLLGRIEKHNVVITFTGAYGTNTATQAVTNLVRSFPNIRFGLMVGIGGAVPRGVLNYDLGKWKHDNEFSIESHLNSPPSILRQAVMHLRSDQRFGRGSMSQYMEKALDLLCNLPDVDDPSFPGWEEDRLFETDYNHVGSRQDCRDCDDGQLVERLARLSTSPVVHYGLIASGNAVMSHKTKRWQAYAAVAAAAYAKDLLRIIGPETVKKTDAATNNMKDVISTLGHVDEGVQKLRETINNTYRQKVLNWLSPIDHDSEQSDFFALRQENTGQWFLESDWFQNWLNGQSKTLLCQGIPGAGKTVMTAIIVHHLHQQFAQADNIGIAYVYGSFLRHNEQHLQAILSSLLKQLSQPLPELPECVTEAYERFWTHHIYPSPEKLLQMLGTLMTSRQKTFVIVDALDEIKASDGTCRQLLLALFRLQQSVPVSLIATSRHVADIASMFRMKRGDFIEIRALDDDVRSYIDGQMNKLRPFVSEDQDLRSKVKETIVQAVDGMFLLAKLHLDSLRDKVSKGDVRRALTILPTGSDARALMWTVCTKRLLTIEGLQHALAITRETERFDEDNMPEVDLIIEVCSGLVTFDEKSKVLRLVHFTAQEYFQRKWKDWFADAHSEIAWVCASYLSSDLFRSGEDQEMPKSQSSSFYDYASSYSQYHVDLGIFDDVFAPQLLENPLIVAQYNKTICPPCLCGSCYAAPSQASALHFAAYLGQTISVKSFLQRNRNCDLEDKYGRTPLAWTADRSAVPAARALLDAGADPNHADALGCTPLFWAAARGSPSLVHLLLKRGGQASIKSNSKDLPLLAAYHREGVYSEGREAVINVLLEHNAAAATTGITDVGCWNMAVQWARRNQLEDIMIVVRKNAPPEHQSALLLSASRGGRLEEVQHLLEAGANPDYRDPPWGRSPLSQAAEYNETAVVSYLLDKGVNPDMLDTKGYADDQDNTDKTPLMWAAMTGAVGPFRVLLEHGADPNKGNRGRRKGLRPIHWAAENGRTEIIKILLERGLEPDVHDYFQQTPLFWAARRGHLQAVALLLDHGADPSQASKEGRLPLSAAAQYGHTDIVSHLLERSIDDIDRCDNTGRTPLCHASMNGHQDVVDSLLQKGAE